MRIVKNLKDTVACPNCGNDMLTAVYKAQTGRFSKFCHECHEEIFENEFTCSEEQPAADREVELITSKELLKKQKKKDDFIFEMREEITNLAWCSHDARSMVLVENIQNIFNKIIDYIEEN